MKNTLIVLIFCALAAPAVANSSITTKAEFEQLTEVEQLRLLLKGRDRALDRLNQQVAQLTEMLSLEQAETSELKNSLSRLTLQLGTLTAERDRLSSQLAVLLPERDMLTNRVAEQTEDDPDPSLPTSLRHQRPL